MNNSNATDLETRGFVVVKNFLSTAEIQHQLADYNIQKSNNSKQIKVKSYSLIRSGTEHKLTDKIKSLFDNIKQQTDISLDLVGPTGLYFDTGLAELGWHQDHESYYVWQTAYHSVNFWIPLIKPCANLSGLRLVPMDVLQTHIGELFTQRMLNQGAKRFITAGNITRVFDDDYGIEYDLPVNIDTIAVAPDLEAGDALLVRGDVIHSTQDADTYRVALGIKTVNGNLSVHRDKFQEQCNMKKLILGAWGTNKRIADYFLDGNDQFIIHDFFKGRV